MKQFLIRCALVVTVLTALVVVSAGPSSFSGTWVLDKSKSQGSASRWENIESYTMIVSQNDQQLTVENKIIGDRGPRAGDPAATGGQDSGAGQGGGRGMGRGRGQGDGRGPGGGQGGVRPQGGRGGRGGLGMPESNVTYKLDGSETRMESAGGRGGAATVKAEWKDGGKILELTNTRTLNFQGNDMTRTSRDRWELTEGGKVLKVKRTTESPRGTQEATLVFNRQ